MADKRISDLSEADTLTVHDLFVVEQNRQTKKLSGQTMTTYLTSLATAHGGIKNITYIEAAEGSLNAKMRITLADNTSYEVDVYNGAKGDTGASTYAHVKYADKMPTANSDMKSEPGPYMGMCCDANQTAPASYLSYTWFKIKGDKGDAGTNGTNGTNGVDGTSVTLDSQSVNYGVSASGINMPTEWSESIPTVEEGRFLWTRVILGFSSGLPVTYYSFAKQGVSGEGSGISSITVTNNGGLSISPQTLTTSGEITIGHANAPITAKTTRALYPVKLDAYGHVVDAGDAVNPIVAPSNPASGQVLSYNGSAWVASDAPASGVSSVNSQTGAVDIFGSAIGAIKDPSTKSNGQVLMWNTESWVASYVSSSPRRNMLINPWFTVDQYKYTKNSVTTRFTLENYFIDCWKRTSGTVTVLDDGNIQITDGTIVQYFEFPMDTSLQYTASVNKVSGNGTVTATFLPNSSPYATFSISVVGTAVINKAKLEAGQGSTLEMDAAPDYSTELDKCRRYMQMYPASASTAPTATGIAFSATSIRALAPLPTMLRVDPSINYVVGTVAKFQCKAGTKSIAPTAASVVRTSNSNIVLILTCSGATEGTIFSVSYASNNLIAALNANL